MSSSLRKFVWIPLIGLTVGVLTVGANVLAHRYSWRWDLTESQQHTLTAATKNLLADLREEVQITVFYAGFPAKYLDDLLAEYERMSEGKVVTKIIDPLVQLGYAAQFGMVINANEHKAIVQSGQDRQDVDFTSVALSEELLNNAMIRVTRPAQHVYFLGGHGEARIADEGDRSLRTLAKLLLANNLIPKTLVLEKDGGVPEDCDVLVIPGPQNHLSEKEVGIVQEYLRRGGDALFLVESVIVTEPDQSLTEDQQDKNPSLNHLLNEWGVRVASDVVVDLVSHASGDVGSPATRNYLTHKAIVSGLDYTFYVRPRSLAMVENRRPDIKVAPLVLTASEKESWGETNRHLQIEFDPREDTAGPVPIAFVIWEPKDTESLEKDSDTRLLVFTDADFVTDAYIKSYSNAQMGLNAIAWLAESDYQIFVDPNEIKVERLDLTSQQKQNVALILFSMPVLIGVVGIGVWLKK